jgi:hypothetical protein
MASYARGEFVTSAVALRARVDGDREALHARKIVSSVSASHNVGKLFIIAAG